MTQPLVAIIDNSIDPKVYTPVDHWTKHLPCASRSYRAPSGDLPGLEGHDFSHIILTGSESSIIERDTWVDREVEFVQDAVQLNIPILGSCWGHQLLALALSGPAAVRRCPLPELGWMTIEVLEGDPLLGDHRHMHDVFTLHFDEVVGLDARYRILASTPHCPVHAFRFVEAPVWGVQSHPEIDIADGRKLLRNLADQRNPNSDLFRSVLETRAQDSGLIRRIVHGFLEIS